MINTRIFAISMLVAAFLAPLIYAQDLSRYREFQFGASLPAVAKQVNMKPSEAKAIHQRPAVIQELEWQAQDVLTPSQRVDSVKSILFSFYNGALFRILVTYDPARTEGMTADDIIEDISAKYGTAIKPVAEIVLSSTSLYSDGEKTISDRSEKVLARWEDEQYSYNLIQSSYQTTFGLVVYSKRLDAQARAAIVEAIRLDEQEVPQRELARQRKKADEDRAKQEKARLVNKRLFRR